MPRFVDVFFFKTRDGIGISGLRKGKMLVAADYTRYLEETSQEGGFYPYQLKQTKWEPARNAFVYEIVDWTGGENESNQSG